MKVQWQVMRQPFHLRSLPKRQAGGANGAVTLELDNNTAERAMRSVAIGRKNYLFVGSQTGGRAAAIAYTLIETAKLNGVDPQGWLADTLACIPDYKITRVDDLLPWNWSNHAA